MAFYWYVKNTSKEANAPLFVIVPNGSGKSVLVSYFTSWGQQKFKRHTNELYDNHANFNKHADLLMVDIPIGTGFSVYSDPSQIPTTVEERTSHFFHFMNQFFNENSELKGRDIYLVSELRGTQATPVYAYKLAKSGFNVKGVISFSNLSNPWISHLSYAPNMEYKKITKKSGKFYKNTNHEAKMCNLYSILGAPNAESYCSIINDMADEHVINILQKTAVASKGDSNARLNQLEKKVSRWLNTERVQKHFNVKSKFYGVDMTVFSVVSQSSTRDFASDAVLTALLNRKIEVYIIVGSMARTANWIGALMSTTRLRWVGQKGFEDAKWSLWNRKNDLKQYENLHFARVFGRSSGFWQVDATEITKFVNEHILHKVPTRNEKKAMKSTKDADHPTSSRVKQIEKEQTEQEQTEQETVNISSGKGVNISIEKKTPNGESVEHITIQ